MHWCGRLSLARVRVGVVFEETLGAEGVGVGPVGGQALGDVGRDDDGAGGVFTIFE